MSLWTYLRRTFTSSAPSLPIDTPAVAPRPPVAQEPSRPARQTVRPHFSAKPAQNVSEAVRECLARSIDGLRGELDAKDLTPDLLVLLDALSGDPSGQLRQLPAAAQQALVACDDPDVPTSALVPLFERDPILAQAVLARANSAYYNPSGIPCLSLAPAISRQGRRSAHNVIMQQVMGGLVCRPGRLWNSMVSQIWSHMVRTGPVARAVAPALGIDPEQAFALGLLHDVGKLVIFDSLAAQRVASRRDLAITPVAITQTLRLLHEPLGALCALHWELGDAAAGAIASHHREPPPASSDPLCEVIWLAEKIDLLEQRGLPLDLDGLWRGGSISGDPTAAAALFASRGADAQAS